VARVAHGERIEELGLRYDIFEVFSLYPNTASDFGRTRTGNLGLAYQISLSERKRLWLDQLLVT
jgi:hypothetical protein